MAQPLLSTRRSRSLGQPDILHEPRGRLLGRRDRAFSAGACATKSAEGLGSSPSLGSAPANASFFGRRSVEDIRSARLLMRPGCSNAMRYATLRQASHIRPLDPQRLQQPESMLR